jgi:hypothetical protein
VASDGSPAGAGSGMTGCLLPEQPILPVHTEKKGVWGRGERPAEAFSCYKRLSMVWAMEKDPE